MSRYSRTHRRAVDRSRVGGDGRCRRSVRGVVEVTAVQAEQTAEQAKAAALAYETAFAETVPPPVVAANRTLLMALVATNLFGQNTPAIAVTEAQYADMWAQDTGAMQGYAGAAAAATTLPPFSEPPASTDSTGLSSQAAAVTQATNTAAGDVQSTVTTVQQTFSAIPNTLSSLANPAAVGDALTPLQTLDLLGDLSSIFVDPEIGTAGVTLDGILAGRLCPTTSTGTTSVCTPTTSSVAGLDYRRGRVRVRRPRHPSRWSTRWDQRFRPDWARRPRSVRCRCHRGGPLRPPPPRAWPR